MTALTPPLKILKASAGSGKTFSLTLHYLNLLLRNESRYKEILAVTFTNKATMEMKTRITEVLYGLATDDKSGIADDYRILLLEKNKEWTRDSLKERATKAYLNILHDYSNFTVSTIDGFSQKVIRNFTYELNLDSGYNIEMNMDKVKSDLSRMLNDSLEEKPEILEWLIEYAEKQIGEDKNWNYRHELLKLTSLIFTDHFQDFHGHIQGYDPDELFDTTKSYIEEESERFLSTLDLAIKNYQKKVAELNIDPEDLKGKSRNKMLSLAKKKYNIKNISGSDLIKHLADFQKLRDDDACFHANKSKEIRTDLQNAILPYVDKILEVFEALPFYIVCFELQSKIYFLRLLIEMSALLTRWRKDNFSILISDAQTLLNKIGLDENKDPTFLWEKIGNRYKYFLFDEFQDTSRLQWNNLNPLLLNALSTSPREESEHLIVGDVKQSIYRWRNGDWRILLEEVEKQVAKAFHLSPTQIPDFIQNETLDYNYRSLPNIVHFNNYIYQETPKIMQDYLNRKIEENGDEEVLTWWKEGQFDSVILRAYENSSQKIPESKLGKDKAQGTIEIDYIPLNSNNYILRDSDVRPQIIQNLNEKIGEWIGSHKYEPGQIGILVRTNKEALEIIENLMEYKKQNNLDFQVISGDALLISSNLAVQLLIETLAALIHPSPEYAVHLAKLTYLHQILTVKTPFESGFWLHFKNNNPSDFKDLLPAPLLQNWAAYKELPLVLLIEKLIEDYNLQSNEQHEHLPYLLEFKDLAQTFTKNGERGIPAFLDYWEEDGVRATLPSDTKIDAIEVITIHKSKGLDYDVVMIPFCGWKMEKSRSDFWINIKEGAFSNFGKLHFPFSKAMGKSLFKKQYYEEFLYNYMDSLNTLYVATTRARQHLYITAPNTKENKGTDENTPDGDRFERKETHITDFIFHALNEKDSPFQTKNGSLHVNTEEVIPKKEKKAEENVTSSISLNEYWVSSFFAQKWEEENDLDLSKIFTMEQAALFGNLAHKILAEIKTVDEIEKHLSHYLVDGIIREEEKNKIQKELKTVLNHPQISRWLSGDYVVKSEAGIITGDGEGKRPDKVFLSAEETIVLDFKFTPIKTQQHQKQVAKYVETIKEIGTNNVKGFLFYAPLNELIEVI